MSEEEIKNKIKELKNHKQDKWDWDEVLQYEIAILRLNKLLLENKINKIKEHTTYIIEITDDERILAECNLIEEELKDE